MINYKFNNINNQRYFFCYSQWTKIMNIQEAGT